MALLKDDQGPRPIAFHLIASALRQDRQLFRELLSRKNGDSLKQCQILFPHASEFASPELLDLISARLFEALNDSRHWFHMNCYHLCYIYDSLMEKVEDYSYCDPEIRQALIPELQGEPINFNQFLNEYFFNTAFLIASERFNQMTPADRSRLGRVDHAYFGTVLPELSLRTEEDPSLAKVINRISPDPEDLELTLATEYPYQP